MPEDEVLLLRPVKGHKLQLAWECPYKVVSKLNKGNYVIQKEEDVSPDALKRDASKDVWEEERELPTLSPAEKLKP